MARAGSLNTPGPFNFPISRAPACAAESPKLSLPGAAPGRLAKGVVADKECTCPASRLMWERYPPTPPTFACCVATGEFGLVAQLAEQPVVCGKAPTPFGSANFRILPRDTGSRCVGPAIPTKKAPVCPKHTGATSA